MPHRTSQELIRASHAFACESRWLSWWHLLSTLGMFCGVLVVVCMDGYHPITRLSGAVVAGLLLVRLFIIYHDFQHRTILKGSRVAGALMMLFGLLTLNPPSIWNRSHNHHHKNNAKMYGAEIGSFPVMTTQEYARASRRDRVLYGASRHPLTIAMGYLTVFLYGMSIRSLLVNPREHFDSAVAIALHVALLSVLIVFEPEDIVLAVLVPSLVAAAVGSYLFYAQHNYPGVMLRTRDRWTYVGAALESSSYFRMSPLMHWFTGNIGYHHVHHLNAHIPFYRLPTVMAAFEELQSPGTTSLRLCDIAACLRLKLWDVEQQQMVGFPPSR